MGWASDLSDPVSLTSPLLPDKGPAHAVLFKDSSRTQDAVIVRTFTLDILSRLPSGAAHPGQLTASREVLLYWFSKLRLEDTAPWQYSCHPI